MAVVVDNSEEFHPEESKHTLLVEESDKEEQAKEYIDDNN